MKYHLPCLVKAKRDIDQSKQPQSATVNFGKLLSDRQLLEMVETELNDSSKDVVMNMNDIHQMYIELLDENELPVLDNPRYKPYLKQLILDNIPDVQFSRPPDKTKLEQILSTRSKDRLIASAVSADVLKEDLKVILRAAKIMRRDIATSCPWQFHGTFDDYEPPALLKTFCKKAVQGTEPFKVQEESHLQTGNNLSIKVHPCLHNTLWGLTDPTDKCRTTPKMLTELSDNILKVHSALALLSTFTRIQDPIHL